MQYITWISNNQTAWTLKAAGMGPDPSVQISARPVAQEPMVCALTLILQGCANFSILVSYSESRDVDKFWTR